MQLMHDVIGDVNLNDKNELWNTIKTVCVILWFRNHEKMLNKDDLDYLPNSVANGLDW